MHWGWLVARQPVLLAVPGPTGAFENLIPFRKKHSPLMRFFRSLYRKHEMSVKIGGFLAFIVVVASLYFFVFSGFISGNAFSGIALQGTPRQFGGGTSSISPVTFPTLPPATPTPPLLPPRYQVAIHPNIAYYSLSALDRRLDLCTPIGAPGTRPGVILIHDTGIPVEDKKVEAPLCSLLASQGFVAIAINFRRFPNVWPDQLVDAQLAVRWLRAHASQYSLDPARLCAMGDSAGGHLAVFLGVLGTNFAGDEAGLLTNQSPKVSCVVDDFGFVDLQRLPNTPFWQGAFGFMFGQKTPPTPAMLYQASPVFYVTSRSAPMLIVHGVLDQTVPPSQSRELQQALQQAAVPVTYISYPGGHGFSQLTAQQYKAVQLQIISYLTTREHP
jgi:acetyl esterase/lipase